jgi:hypothetical protein
VTENATLDFSKRGAGIPQNFISSATEMLKASAVAAVIAACADPASAFTVSLTRWKGREFSPEASFGEACTSGCFPVVEGAKRKLALTRLEDAGTD